MFKSSVYGRCSYGNRTHKAHLGLGKSGSGFGTKVDSGSRILSSQNEKASARAVCIETFHHRFKADQPLNSLPPCSDTGADFALQPILRRLTAQLERRLIFLQPLA